SIPVLLEQARAAFGGEDEDAPGHRHRPAEPVREAARPASVAERLGRVIGRLLQRLGLFRAG
ncbi:hypothetical protein, partial [Inquilinus limosus]